MSPAQTTQPAFEVATVKIAPKADPSTGSWSPPGIGRFTATHVPLAVLIQLAYGIDKSLITNKPSWLDDTLYDIDAKPEDGVKLDREELKPRLQQLLRERFHLVTHADTKNVRGYALVVSREGLLLAPTKGDHFPGYRINVSRGQMKGVNWSMPILAKYLTAAVGFPVVDETGLSGSYDVSFSYDPQSNDDGVLPPLETALRQATGLVLKAKSVSVSTLVIDSVDETPTTN